MEKHEKLPILRVVPVGNLEFERFLIVDERDRLWSGSGFTSTGLFYANHNAAALDAHKILKSHFQGVEPERYVVPLYVEVFSREPVHMMDVARHLSCTSRLHLNTTEFGHGPTESLVLPWIEWGQIKDAKEFLHD